MGERFPGIDMSLWITLVVPGAFLLIALVYHCVRAPYEIYEEHHREIVALRGDISGLIAKQTPRFEFACGDDVPGSISRNNDLRFRAERNWMPELTFSVDFFSVVVTNSGNDPITNCHAELLKLEKGGTPIWTRQSTLSFEPRGKEPEPVNKVDLLGHTSRNFALCSIRSDGAVMHSSLNQNWRNQQTFESLFDGPGEYVFTVQVAGLGSATATPVFALNWTGQKSKSTLRMMCTSNTPGSTAS